jgi:hypothetical protein
MKLGLGQSLVNTRLPIVSALSSFANQYSMDFDGVNDRMTVLNSQTIGRTQNISISVWMKLDASGRQLIVGNYTSSNYGVGFHEIAGDIMIFQLGDVTNDSYFNSRVASFSTYAPTGTWNHWLGTWDGTDSKIYINGVLRNTWTPPSPLTIQWYGPSGNFLIGTFSTSYNPNGRIDELGLFDTAVPIGDVWDGSGKPIDITGVTGLTNNWRMGDDATFDGTNWTVPDVVGSSIGTTKNMDISDRVEDVPPTFNFKSLAFDGVNDYVGLATNLPLGTTSVSFWMKSTDLVNGGVSTGLGALNFIGATRRPLIFLGPGNYKYFPEQLSKFDDNWHHWFILIAGADRYDINNCRLFVDGAEIGAGTVGNTSGFPNPWTSSLIGKGYYGALFCHVDEFAVWQSDETSNISTLSTSPIVDISSLSPIGWWRMGDDDTYPTITDIGSGSSNGTMINMDASDIVTDVPT